MGSVNKGASFLFFAISPEVFSAIGVSFAFLFERHTMLATHYISRTAARA